MKYLLLISVILVSCQKQKETQIDDGLIRAASEGTTFTNDYLVITDNNVDAIKIDSLTQDTIHSKLFRGNVLEDYPFSAAPMGCRAVRIPEQKEWWFIKKDAPFYRQFMPGMRYPVIGVVKDEKTTLTYYNQETKKEENMELEVGETYFWLILKDGDYVNILKDSLGKSITGRLGEKASIIQKEEHLKIVPDKSRKRLVEVWK